MILSMFAPSVDIDIEFDGEELRKKVDMKIDKANTTSCPVYYDGDSIAGQVTIRVRQGQKVNHQGIKVEFIGSIEALHDRSRCQEFLSLSQKCREAVRELPGNQCQATLLWRPDITKERNIWVHSYRMPPDSNNSMKMEVGIENCLHLEFEYNKSKYHLKDVVIGKIEFLLVRVKIIRMKLSILREETTGPLPNQYKKSEIVTSMEIMDGAPVRGECIPIRLILRGFDLTPTFREVNKKFSTRYYLLLLLIDEGERRYHKKQEITIFRIPEN